MFLRAIVSEGWGRMGYSRHLLCIFAGKLMLGLLKSTDPAWAKAAASNLPSLLLDHAHCELKAAQSALSLVGRYAGEAPEMVDDLLALAREETSHFEQVRKVAEARGHSLAPPEVDHYVISLRKAAKSLKGEALQNRLLVSAVIEARSCERFRVLADYLSAGTAEDVELSVFYRGLMESEARHFQMFRKMATDRFGASAESALRELMDYEAEIVSGLTNGPTVHG